MSKLKIAAGTRIAAEAGASVAEQGGNAVDAAIAAMAVSVCTDTGIMSPGCGAFVTVWPPDAEPVVIDGYAEMPGRGYGEQAGRAAFQPVVSHRSEAKRRMRSCSTTAVTPVSW